MQRIGVFRSRFFWKLYSTYAALVLATTLVVGMLVEHQMARSLLTDVATSLRDKTLLMEPYATQAFVGGITPDIAHQVRRLGRRTGVRITLIAPDGSVLADSEAEPSRMDNHGNRPEVLAARTRPLGVSRRYSRTLQQYMLYTARAVRAEGRALGTVRTSMPLRVIDARLASMRMTIVMGAAFGVLVALAVGMIVARQVTVPIAEMTAVAGALREGQYNARVKNAPRDEIGLLGNTLNRLGTELTRRIATITHDQAELRAMIAGMVEGVIAVDDEDRVMHCNHAAMKLLGVERPIEGERFWEVTRVVDLVELLGEARSRGRPVRRETVLYDHDSTVILDAHATAFSTPDSGGLVLVLHDISDLRKLERIRRDFVANVSHELKTPLTSIKGYVETLLTGALKDPENNVRFLEKIDAHVNRLNDLVRDLLGLARVESLGGRLALTAVNWRPILEAALQRHEAVLGRKKITCTVTGTCPDVRGDVEGMTQIVDNLLDNAINYTPNGGSITMRLSMQGSEGCLAIEDTGIGIPEAERDRIFERFYRVDKGRSRELGGTGLGLAIVKHFAQAMQGTVIVQGAAGKGSVFTVRLALST